MTPPHTLRATLAAAAAGFALSAVVATAPAHALSDPEVAVDPAGTAHLSWIRHDGMRPLLRSRDHAPDGTLGEADWISPDGGGVMQPVIGADAAGGTLHAWLSLEPGQNMIRVRRRGADGSMSATQTIAGPEVTEPRMGVAPDGSAVIAWLRTVDGKSVLEARRRSPSGTLGPVKRLSAEAPTHSAAHPDLAVDAAGNAVATWVMSGPARHVQVRRLRADGVLSTIKNVTSPNVGPTSDIAEPDVAVDANGHAIVAFRRRRDTRYLIQARRRSAGGTLGTIRDLSALHTSSNMLAPEVAMDATGAATVAWLTNSYLGELESVRLAPDGTPGPLATVAAGDAPYTLFFSLGLDADGDAVFVWMRYNANKTWVQVRGRTAAGSLSQISNLTPPTGSVSYPKVGVQPDGNAVVAWKDYNADEIKIRRRHEDGTVFAPEVLAR